MLNAIDDRHHLCEIRLGPQNHCIAPMPQYPPGPKAVSAGDKPYCDFLWGKLPAYPVPEPPEGIHLGYSKLVQKGFGHRCEHLAPIGTDASVWPPGDRCEH